MLACSVCPRDQQQQRCLEHIRNTSAWVLPQTSGLRNSRLGPEICVVRSPPREADGPISWPSTGLLYLCVCRSQWRPSSVNAVGLPWTGRGLSFMCPYSTSVPSALGPRCHSPLVCLSTRLGVLPGQGLCLLVQGCMYS